MPDGSPWSDMARAILDTIEGRAKAFLDQNAHVRPLIADRAERLARLGWEYATATEEARSGILDSIAIVKQTIENDLNTVALNGATEAKSTFKEIVATAFGLFTKALPVIIAAL